MRGSWIKVPLFTVFLVGMFVWAGEVVTRASGGGGNATLGEGVSVAKGEQIFWDAGKCYTCHSVGMKGGSVRGPNIGQSPVGPEMALRAIERARERSALVGREMSATEYLIESIANPSAYVVEGFKDEMPMVFEPPISLGPEEVSSVILYLQSLGGAPDPSVIVLPPEIREAGRSRSAEDPWEPYLDGDSIRGQEIFFDTSGPAACTKCHAVQDQGGDVGPELTSVAGTRTARFIVESILQPNNEIANGYQSILVQMNDGRILDGVLRRETTDSLWLGTSEGDVVALALGDVARRREQEVSLMPDNFAEILTVEQLHDLLAYLRTLR